MLKAIDTIASGLNSLPTLTSKACAHRGCAAVGDSRFCDLHKNNQDHRSSAARRGYNRRHRAWRELVLAAHPICEACRHAEAIVADHIVPLSAGGDYSLENGQGLCARCHAQKTARERLTRYPRGQ